jgi:hypothetical protein
MSSYFKNLRMPPGQTGGIYVLGTTAEHLSPASSSNLCFMQRVPGIYPLPPITCLCRPSFNTVQRLYTQSIFTVKCARPSTIQYCFVHQRFSAFLFRIPASYFFFKPGQRPLRQMDRRFLIFNNSNIFSVMPSFTGHIDYLLIQPNRHHFE